MSSGKKRKRQVTETALEFNKTHGSNGADICALSREAGGKQARHATRLSNRHADSRHTKQHGAQQIVSCKDNQQLGALDAGELADVRAAAQAVQQQEVAILRRSAQAVDAMSHVPVAQPDGACAPEQQPSSAEDGSAAMQTSGKQGAPKQASHTGLVGHIHDVHASSRLPARADGGLREGASTSAPQQSARVPSTATHLPAVRRRQVFGGREKRTFVQLGLSQARAYPTFSPRLVVQLACMCIIQRYISGIVTAHACDTVRSTSTSAR